MKQIIFSALAIILVAGCAKLEEGVIIDKWYEEETETFTLMPIPISTGKSTIITMIPYYIWDGEDFCVKIEGYNNKGKLKSKTLYLNKDMWDTLSVGTNLCISDDCSSEDTSFKKEEQ